MLRTLTAFVIASTPLLLIVSACSSAPSSRTPTDQSDARETICFNKNDEAVSGLTPGEYYLAIDSSCEEKLLEHQLADLRKRKLASKVKTETMKTK